MTEFIAENNKVNEEAKADPLPRGVLEIQTADGSSILVNQIIWECYFAPEVRSINLPKVAALLLLRLLNGELSDQKITDWVKQIIKDMFNGLLVKLESALSAIDVWLEIAAADGLDNEAADFIKNYTSMLNARVLAMHFIEDANGELYRKMHVDKNLM